MNARHIGAAVLASGVLLGCTSILGSFEVGSGEPGGSGEGGGGNDATTNLDGGGPQDGAAVDSAPPLMCGAGETKCIGEGVCAVLGTNAEHCGKCGRSCGGGRCDNGVCSPSKLYDGTLAVGPIDVSDVDIYFATTDGDIQNKLLSCPKSTGCKTTPKQLAVMQYSIDAIAMVQKQTITFLSAPTQSTQRPAIYACTPAGCPSPPVSFAGDGLNGVEPRLPVFKDRVFHNRGGSGPGFSTCPVTTPGTCADNTAVGGTTRNGHGLVANASNVYFVDAVSRGAAIVSCLLTDTACVPVPVVPGDQNDVESLAIEGGKLFWIKPGRDSFNEGKLFSCDLPACTTPKLVANGLFTSPLVPNHLFVDSSGAYWMTTDKKVQRCLPNGCVGGAQDFVAGPLDTPHGIVADPNFIYWAEKTAVWRLAK